MAHPTKHTYRSLIEEAFIKPIRSVLIVDDDYPTLHEMLTSEDQLEDWQKRKQWRTKPETVKAVIDQFRRPDAPHILDIHDGHVPDQETEKQEVSELQQTDLLILDYELNRIDRGGRQAVDIARRALANPHFNLVLVHTKTELTTVFEEFLLGFLQPIFMQQEKRANLPDVVTDFIEENRSELTAAIDFNNYQTTRRDTAKATRSLFSGGNEWAAANKLFDDKGLPKNGLRRQIVCEWFAQYEDSKRALFANSETGKVAWCFREPYYIQGDRGLIAFTGKDGKTDLLKTLTDTLEAWSPRPSRLMLTKLRAEMNTRGIEVEDDALFHSSTGAIWYETMLLADAAMRSQQVGRTVGNHAEQLLDCLLPKVNEFVTAMVECDQERGDAQEIAGNRYNVDLTDPVTRADGLLRHNVFAGSKRPSVTHLEIGHLLRIKDELWLCVSPACDLMPDQGENFEDLKRVTLMRLVSAEKPKEALTTAHTGSNMFFELPAPDSIVALTDKHPTQGAPTWCTAFAVGKGMLRREGDLPATIELRFAHREEGGTLAWQPREASVVGQLRYEYALHMQSKFISSQARIGLDFQSVR